MYRSANTDKNRRRGILTLLLLAALLLTVCRSSTEPPEEMESTADTSTETIPAETAEETPEKVPEDTEEPEQAIPEEEAFLAAYYLDFTNPDALGFYSEHDMTHAADGEGIRFSATGHDPLIHIAAPTAPTDKLVWAAVVYKTDLTGIRGEFYAHRADGVRMGESGSHVDWYWGTDCHEDGDYRVEVIPLTAWSEDDTLLTELRLDPMAGDLHTDDAITICTIAFFSREEDARTFTRASYAEKLIALEEQKKAAEEARLAALRKDWAVPEYREIDISDRDNTPGTLSLTPSADGETVLISYTLDGTPVSHTVPNQVQYLSGPYAATDDLGRSLYTEEDEIQLYETLDEIHSVGALGDHGEHDVGIFYFLWQGEHGDVGAYDMEKILANPGAEDPDYEGWGPVNSFHFFAEPLYGYYYSSDTWVMRKHMELLSAAGVDFLYFDVTNAHTYLDNALALMEICHNMNEQGFDAPQVVFYTNTDAAAVVKELYDNIYAPNLYPDTWYRLDGKPLIIVPAGVQVDDMFSVRLTQWPTQEHKKNAWPWIDFTLKQQHFRNADGEKEVMSVSVAQHSGTVCFSDSRIYGDLTNRGRSFLPYYDGKAYKGTYDLLSEDSYLYGYNFGAQFARAIRENVRYVLVTGWNEWVAGRQAPGYEGRDDQVIFVDTCGVEFSRDIEMTRGYYFDNYYMQLAANIQALKGAVPDLVQDMRKTINVTGDFDQWDAVPVTYTDPSGDNRNRDSLGYGYRKYTDKTGRNDIVSANVTADSQSLYFYVQTAAPITNYDNESAWMQLYLNTDGDTTGWYGYDYCIGEQVIDDFTLGAVRFTGETRSDTEEAGTVSMRVSGCEMMVEVPLAMLGITDYKNIVLQFKWADSTRIIDEMEDFYCEGDAAPIGRMNWVYRNCK